MTSIWSRNAGSLGAAAGVYGVGLLLGVVVAWSATPGAGTHTGDTGVLPLVQHNALVVLALVVGGLTLGAGTLLLLLFNGSTLGLTGSLAARLHPPEDVLLAVVPHAVLEVPATLLAGAAGLKLAHAAYACACGRSPGLARVAVEAATLTAVALCLVALAAPLETHVSVRLAPPGP